MCQVVTQSLFGAVPVVKSAQHLHGLALEKRGLTLEADKFTSSRSRV